MAKRQHRFEPYKDDIAELLGQGKTYSEIEEWLYDKGINSSEAELCIWCQRNGIKNLIQSGRHSDSVPNCRTCHNYMEIGVKHVQHKSNIRVCKGCLEAIPKNVQTSPEWCCLRGKVE